MSLFGPNQAMQPTVSGMILARNRVAIRRGKKALTRVCRADNVAGCKTTVFFETLSEIEEPRIRQAVRRKSL